MRISSVNKNYLKILILVLSALLFSSNSYALQADNSIDLIRNDLEKNNITLDEFTLLIVNVIKNPSALPSEYKSFSLASSYNPEQCVTAELIYIKNNWALLSATTQATFSEAMARLTTSFTYDSPGGFFKLHYDPASGLIVIIFLLGTFFISSREGYLSM